MDRILVVGAGSSGQRHLRLARLLNPDAEIKVLRHANCAGAPKPADGCLTGMEAALAFAPQIAVIANPATRHIEVARPLAEIGCHLLVEKPLAGGTESVGDFLDVCRKAGSIVVIGYNLRFLPSLQHFRSLLAQKCVGRVLSVRAEAGQYLPSWRANIDYRTSVSARRDLGGGVLLELSHEVDYLRWLFGDVSWIQATLRRQSALELDVEDTAHLILGFGSATDHHEVVASLNIDFIRHDPVRQCTVIGDSGSLRWSAFTGTVELYRSSAESWETLFYDEHQADGSYIAEWKHFLACVRGEAMPLVSGEEGLAVLRILDAARRSAHTKRTVLL